MKIYSKKKELWPNVKSVGSLPKSREEALANPVIYTYNEKDSAKEFKKGNLDWIRFDLSRPESLEFDWGIKIKEPTQSGELTLCID